MAYQDPNSPAGNAVATGGVGFAAGEAASLANAAFQYYNQKALNRQANSMTQENMRLQKKLNLEQQYQSIANSTSAYKAAGLNPALAVGAPAAGPVSSHSANAGAAGLPSTPDVAALLGAGAQLDMLDAQKENIRENTELQKEQAREKKIENNRKESEDYTINEHLPYLIEYMKSNADDEFTLGWLDEFSQNSKNLVQDKGTLDALNNIFFEMTRQDRSKTLEELINQMDITVMKMQLTNGTAAAVADLPKANRKLIYKNMLRMDAEIARFNAETRNVQEDTKFFKERREQTAATVAKLGQETLALLHNDKVALYDAGEIGALGLTLGFDAVEQFAHGAGFGTGLAVAGKLAGGSGKDGTSLTKPVFESPKRVESQPYGKPVPRDVLESIREASRSTAKGDKVYEAQLFNAAVKRWKAQNGYK